MLISGNAGFSKRARGSTWATLSPSRALSGVLALQRDRWVLWLPVAMIGGAAAYLLAPFNPPWWPAAAGFVLAGLGAGAISVLPGEAGPWVMAFRRLLAGLLSLSSAACLGAIAADQRTRSVTQTPLVIAEAPRVVEGWVVSNDASDRGPRLRLLVRSIEGMPTPPRYVRLAVSETGLLTPGRAARCYGVLAPPAGPMAPGAYDFARRAYFEQLAATGFAFGRCRPMQYAPPPRLVDRARLLLAALRSDLAAAIYAAAPGRGGAIAAALVTGDRSSIDPETNAALRDSGLGHLLSVSGIHMGVVGGLVFALVLRVLSLVAPIALRFPVKKIAALGALFVLAAYLIVSGASVPALRSFVMACVAFGAILLDRPAISMRGLALAAAIVVLLFPESVLEPGFQMSFAATMALVALFEVMKREAAEPALPTPGPLIGALQAATRGLGGVLLISLVAGLATDPFAIYHFQRFAVYALPSNLIAAPIMSFLVAPMAAVAAVLAPFGLADPALELMASALDLIAAVGQTFGARPEAVRALPRPPDLAFLLCVAALLWACLWRGGVRWLGAAFLIASIGLYWSAPRPVAAFDADLRAVFVRENGRWTFVPGRGTSTYARDRLGAMLGMAPGELDRLAPPEACGDHVCQWRLADQRVVLVRAAVAIDHVCSGSDIVIANFDAQSLSNGCKPAALVDAATLAHRGGAFVYWRANALTIEHARSMHVRRPWTPAATGPDVDQE